MDPASEEVKPKVALRLRSTDPSSGPEVRLVCGAAVSPGPPVTTTVNDTGTGSFAPSATVTVTG